MYAEFDKEIKIVENVIMVGENSVMVSEVENLEEMITARVQRKANNGKLLENPLDRNKLSLVFLGDDGGGSFKGGISIGECENQNSPENFTPVVVVSGKTNKEIIYASCERIAAKLEKIKTITVKINGEDRVYETEWSLGGDYQFDLHCCGRKAAGSNCYCIWCRFKRRTRLFKDATSLERGETRQNFDQLPDDDGYDSPPLFKNILPFFVLLPLLHIFLGIGLLFINAIEEILKQFDYEALTPQEREAYEQEMLEKDKQINEAKKAFELLEKTVEEKTQIVETLHDITDLKLTKNEMDESVKGCCMEFCCERVGYESGEIRYCVCCKKKPQGYHQLCLGTLRSKTQIKCSEVEKYEKGGGLLSNIQKVIKQHEKELEISIGKKRKAEMKLDGLFMKKFDELGPNMKEYNEILMELNVTKQAWYQTFTGNHMRMLLKRADIFTRLTAIEKSSKLQHLVKALSLLKKIQDYTEARYLTEEEIANLKVDVENIKNHMKENLGDFNVIPKFHILIHHVVEIAELRKTIGLFTEQQIEHVHALFNTELRRAKFLRKQKRNSWMMKEMYRRNAMKDAFGSLADANYN
uniref:Uncharacterized protein n=1 Tax=Panagrolaimus davidi TaxID=227884 RepID=A0A914P987_9BILA